MIYMSPLYYGYTDSLYHYGVPGMKWGVRKAREYMTKANRYARTGSLIAQHKTGVAATKLRRSLGSSATMKKMRITGYSSLVSAGLVKDALASKFRSTTASDIMKYVNSQSGKDQMKYISSFVSQYSHSATANRPTTNALGALRDHNKALSRISSGALRSAGRRARNASLDRLYDRTLNPTTTPIIRKGIAVARNLYTEPASQLGSSYNRYRETYNSDSRREIQRYLKTLFN